MLVSVRKTASVATSIVRSRIDHGPDDQTAHTSKSPKQSDQSYQRLLYVIDPCNSSHETHP